MVLAIKFPYPTTYQANTFRIILSLAAGAFVVFLPGSITVATTTSKNIAIKAAGAFAVFLIVYLINPATVVSKPVNKLKPSSGLAYGYYYNYLSYVIKKLNSDSTFFYVDSARDTTEKNLEEFRFIVCIPTSPSVADLDNLKSLSKKYVNPVYLFIPAVNRSYTMYVPKYQKNTERTEFLDIPSAVNVIEGYAEQLVKENPEANKQKIIDEETLVFKQTLLELLQKNQLMKSVCIIRDINSKADAEDVSKFFNEF